MQHHPDETLSLSGGTLAASPRPSMSTWQSAAASTSATVVETADERAPLSTVKEEEEEQQAARSKRGSIDDVYMWVFYWGTMRWFTSFILLGGAAAVIGWKFEEHNLVPYAAPAIGIVSSRRPPLPHVAKREAGISARATSRGG